MTLCMTTMWSCSLLSTTECVTGIEVRLTGWLCCRQTRSSLSSACTAVVAERRCVDGLRIRFHQSPWKIALSLQENRPGLAFGSRGVQCGQHAALRVSQWGTASAVNGRTGTWSGPGRRYEGTVQTTAGVAADGNEPTTTSLIKLAQWHAFFYLPTSGVL